MARKKMSHEDAREMLMNDGILFDQDFHALGSSEIDRLAQAAEATGYRKRKDAPGSKVRMYYQFLQRLPARAGHESLATGAQMTRKKTAAQLDREIAESLAKEPGSGGPRILKISSDRSFAGQRSITADVQYPGESPSRVEFVGPSGNIVGPVVMVTKGGQTRVHDPSRFGAFNKDWVRHFFE